MNKIINIKTAPYILILILIIVLGFSCQKNGDLKREAAFKDQNISALADTITTVKMKNGELNSSITGFIASEKDLKHLNKELYDDVKAQSGKVLTLNNVVIKLKQDKRILEKFISESESVAEVTEQINDSTYHLPWTLTYRYDSLNYDIFSGKTELFANRGSDITHNRTWLENRETQISLTFGQIVEDNKLRVFAQSGYPGFTTESLQGVLIDPNSNPYIKSLIKPRRWFTGLSVGIGTTIGYNIPSGGFGMTIGPTISWNIYSWQK